VFIGRYLATAVSSGSAVAVFQLSCHNIPGMLYEAEGRALIQVMHANEGGVQTAVSSIDNGRRGWNCRLVIAKVNGISLKS
jgi:hypothetical protein